MHRDRAELVRICRRLTEMADSDDDNKAEMSGLLQKFFGDSGFKVVEVADKLGITDQTIYRWLKAAGGKPKATYMRRLRSLVDHQGVVAHEPPARTIRIAIPPQWDAALITAFEMGFAAHNVTPQFLRLPAMHSTAHRAFQEREIDVAIQSHFLVQYDHALRTMGLPDHLGLAIRQLLFVFSGYYIYVRRETVDRAARNEATPEGARRLLKALLNDGQYAWFTGDPIARKDSWTAVLRGAHIGVERWTGMELALRAAYELADLSFQEDARVNLRNDSIGGTEVPIGSQRTDPNFVSVGQALEAFEEGVVDVFCGGLAPHHYLRHHLGRPRQNRSTDCPTGGPQHFLLMAPKDIGVSSYTGVVARDDVDDETVRLVASVWQGGVRLFRRWSAEIKDPDLKSKSGSLAMSQLAAMLRVDEASVPEGLRIMDADLFETARWQEWSQRVEKQNSFAQDAAKQDAAKLARLGAEFYREDWRQRVREWSGLLGEHCRFFNTQAEAETAFARRHQDQGERWADFLYGQMEKMAKMLVKARLDHPRPLNGHERLGPDLPQEAYAPGGELQTVK